MNQNPTVCLYMKDTFLCQAEGNLVDRKARELKGQMLPCGVFDQTIFYPQGGGQPADKGTIHIKDETYEVVHVGFDSQTSQVIHYLDHEITAEPGAMATFKVDSEYRLLNAKAHTAGHLIGSVVQEISQNHLIATVGNHMPNQYSVLFTYDANNQNGLQEVYQQDLPFSSNDALTHQVNHRLSQLIQDKMPIDTTYADPDVLENLILPEGYEVPKGKPCRITHIQTLPPVPCGGTHVDNLSHFKSIEITKISMKKSSKERPKVPKLSYLFS